MSRVDDIAKKAEELVGMISNDDGSFSQEAECFLLGVAPVEWDDLGEVMQRVFESRVNAAGGLADIGMQGALMISFQIGLEYGVAAQMTMPKATT